MLKFSILLDNKHQKNWSVDYGLKKAKESVKRLQVFSQKSVLLARAMGYNVFSPMVKKKRNFWSFLSKLPISPVFLFISPVIYLFIYFSSFRNGLCSSKRISEIQNAFATIL